MSPKKWWLEDEFSSLNGPFWGHMLVFWGVSTFSLFPSTVESQGDSWRWLVGHPWDAFRGAYGSTRSTTHGSVREDARKVAESSRGSCTYIDCGGGCKMVYTCIMYFYMHHIYNLLFMYSHACVIYRCFFQYVWCKVEWGRMSTW